MRSLVRSSVCVVLIVAALLLVSIPILEMEQAPKEDVIEQKTPPVQGTSLKILGEQNGDEPVAALMTAPPGASVVQYSIPLGTRGKWNEVYNETFEGATWNTGWTINDQNTNSGNDYWWRDLTNPRTGLYSLNCSAGPISGSPGNGVGYDNNMDAWARYGPFDMRNILDAEMSFWLNMSVESNSAGFDYFFYGCNVWPADGLTYYGYVVSGNQSWRQITFDLTKYDGVSRTVVNKAYVNISLVFVSNGTVCGDSGFHGAFIDDLVIINKTNVAPSKPINLGVVAPHVRRVVDQEPVLTWDFTDPDGTKWEAQSRYHIQVSDDSDFSDIASDNLWNHNETTGTFGQLEYCKYNRTGGAKGMYDGDTYYFRLKTRDADDLWGDWSDPYEFTHNDAPSVPTITTPSGAQVYTGGNLVQIDWTVSTNPDDYTPPATDTITINLSYALNMTGPWTSISAGESNDGTYSSWTVPSTVESNTCYIRATAYDSWEETHSYFGPFTIDNFAPVINSINVSSDKGAYLYAEDLSISSAKVWFNSLATMGDGQKVSVVVNWTDATKSGISGNAVFDGSQTGGAPYDTLTYTVSSAIIADQSMIITVTDNFAKTDDITISFKVDNTNPVAPASVNCHADVIPDDLAYDDDMDFFLTWVNGTDADSGIGHSLIGLSDPPSIQKFNNTHNFTAPGKNITVTAYVQMIDNVGNPGPVLSDNISIDYADPPLPVITSTTHPDENLWYNDKDPYFSWAPPVDISGIAGYSLLFDGVSDTTPTTAVSDTNNFTTETGVAEGDWYLHVRAQDNVGYWSPAAHFRVRVDTTAPDLVNKTPNKGFSGQDLDFGFSATDVASGVDGGSGVVYWKYAGEPDYTPAVMDSDGMNFTYSISIPANVTTDIQYYFTVNDTSNPSNMGRFPLSGDIVLPVSDGVPPILVQVTGNISAGTGDVVNITALVKDNIDVAEVRLYVVGQQAVIMTPGETTALGTTFRHQISVPETSLSTIRYYVWAMDTGGLSSREPIAAQYLVSVSDTLTPVLSKTTKNTTGSPGGAVLIATAAEDNIDDHSNLTAKVHVVDKGAESEFDMSYTDQKFMFNLNLNPTQRDDLNYYITVEDSAGNKVTTGLYYVFIPQVLSPVKDQVYYGSVDINWAAMNLSGYGITVSLYYRLADSNQWGTIDTNLDNTYTYNWNVAAFDNGEYFVKVRLMYSSIDNVLISEVESYKFIIYNPTKPVITLSSPRKGTYYDEIEIKWTATDADPVDTLTVDLFYKGEEDWEEIATGVDPKDGIYYWDVSEMEVGTYWVKAVATDDSVFALSSEAVVKEISIDNTITIDVSTGDVQPVSESFTVEWNVYAYDGKTLYEPPEGTGYTVVVEYDPGTGYVELGSFLTSNGSFTWDLTDVDAGTYEFRVTYTADNGKTVEDVRTVEVEAKKTASSGSNYLLWIIIAAIVVVLIIVIIIVVIVMKRKKKEEELPPEPPQVEEDAEGEGLPDVVPDEPTIPESMYDDQFPVDQSPYAPPEPMVEETPPAVDEAPPVSQELPPSAMSLPDTEEPAALPPAGEGTVSGLDRLLETTPEGGEELTELQPLDEGPPEKREKQLDDLFDGF